MRKYHLGDLLTMSEVILASFLLIMAFLGTSVDYAIWVFAGGELCDAFDGPCARRWHYPDDGKPRWWRKHHILIDQLSDIYLAITCGIYLIWRVNTSLGCTLLFGVGAMCVFVQLYLYKFDFTSHRFVPRPMSASEHRNIVITRRLAYELIGVGGAIAILIFHTSWPLGVKIIVSVIGVIVILPALLNFKAPRLKDEVTPL